MRSSTNKKALERTYTSQCQGLFCLVFRQYTWLPVVSNDGTYSFMEFTSTKFSTTLKNINKIWLYCFVNRADTLYWYWCSSTFKNILTLLCLCTTRAIIHKYRCRSPLNCCYSNIFWALSYRQHVHPKDPTEYILWQHLGFCTVKPKLSINRKQERERKKDKMNYKSIILGLNTSVWLFQIKPKEKADCTWFRLLTQIVVHVYRLHTHWSSWEKLGSVSSTHFSACTVKEDQQFPSTTELCPSNPILWNFSSCFIPSCFRVWILCV